MPRRKPSNRRLEIRMPREGGSSEGWKGKERKGKGRVMALRIGLVGRVKLVFAELVEVGVGEEAVGTLERFGSCGRH